MKGIYCFCTAEGMEKKSGVEGRSYPNHRSRIIMLLQVVTGRDSIVCKVVQTLMTASAFSLMTSRCSELISAHRW